MSLQTIFYIVAIVYMVAQIIVFVTICLLLYAIKQKIQAVNTTVKHILTHPDELALTLGTAVAQQVISRLKRFFPFMPGK